jgi:hypothetical protein
MLSETARFTPENIQKLEATGAKRDFDKNPRFARFVI